MHFCQTTRPITKFGTLTIFLICNSFFDRVSYRLQYYACIIFHYRLPINREIKHLFTAKKKSFQGYKNSFPNTVYVSSVDFFNNFRVFAQHFEIARQQTAG